MGRKRRRDKKPTGADIFYSELLRCELRSGLVHIEVGSGSHREGGLIPLTVAVELHRALGKLIERATTHAIERLSFVAQD